MKPLILLLALSMTAGCASIPTAEPFDASMIAPGADDAPELVIFPGEGLSGYYLYQVDTGDGEPRKLVPSTYQQVELLPGKHVIAARPRAVGEDSALLNATAFMLTAGLSVELMSDWTHNLPRAEATIDLQAGDVVFMELYGESEEFQQACSEGDSSILVCERTRLLLKFREIGPEEAVTRLEGFRRACHEDC